MKVLSSALIALLVSAPAFASVNVTIPKGTSAVVVMEDTVTGDAIIAAEMADGSMRKLADTNKAQIDSDAPVSKIFEEYGDTEESGERLNVNPSFYNNQYDNGSVEHIVKERTEIFRRRYPSGASSTVTGGVNEGRNYFRQNQGVRRHDFVPVPVPVEPLPPITRGPAPYGYNYNGF